MRNGTHPALSKHGISYNGGGWYELPDGRKVRGIDNVLAGNSSERFNRTQFARRAGLQYSGKRAIYEAAGYIKQGRIRFRDYLSYYERGDISGRIIDMFPSATWKNSPEVLDGEGEEANDDTEFTRTFNALAKRLGLWHRFERADRLSRIGRFGVLLIGTGATDQELRQPLGTLSGPDNVLYLSPFHEGLAEINTWITDPADPGFGTPETYKIKLSSGVKNFDAPDAIVHHSHVIHIAEDLLSDEVYGRPVLKRVLNRIFDDEKVMAATGEAFWQLADQILQGTVDPDAQADGKTLDKMGEAMEEMVHDLRRHFLGQGVELGWIGGETPDPTGPADAFATRIAAGAGYPKRILFGTETGERASQQDERNWLGSVSERQEHTAEPVILRPFIDRLVDHGALPAPTDGTYTVVWPSLFEAPEEERAQVSLTRAQTAKALVPVGGDPRTLVTIDEDNTVHLRPLTEDDADGLAEVTPPDIAPTPVEDDEAA